MQTEVAELPFSFILQQSQNVLDFSETFGINCRAYSFSSLFILDATT